MEVNDLNFTRYINIFIVYCKAKHRYTFYHTKVMMSKWLLIRTLKPTLLLFLLFSLTLIYGCLLLADDDDVVGELFTPKVLEKFSMICKGEANPDCAPYEGTNNIHPIILISSQGGGHAWSGDLPPGWWTTNEYDVELVACLSEQIDNVIEYCVYIGDPDIQRHQYTISAKLWEAKTGTLLESRTFEGPLPRSCAKYEKRDKKHIYGGYVKFSDVLNWLEPYVKK